MLNAKKANELAQRTLKNWGASRKWWDAFWVTETMYDCGTQWATVSARSGNLAVRYLKDHVEPDAAKLRVTLNKIHPEVALLTAKTNPRQITASTKGRDNLTSTYTRTADLLLKEIINEVEATSQFSDMNATRHILGSSILRLVLRAKGRGTAIARNPGLKRNITLRRLAVELAHVYPWEVIRDPAAKSLRFHRDEIVFGHQKPRTVEWVQKHYGFKPKTESTMGKLLDFQDELVAARGNGQSHLLTDSEQPGVIWHEFYYQDGDVDADWPWMYPCWTDPVSERGLLKPVPDWGNAGLAPNPFCCLPFFMFNFDDKAIESAFGRGVPWVLMQHQNLTNVSITWLARLLQQGGGKLMYQDRTIENPKRALNPDPWQPIAVRLPHQWSQYPQRLQPPQIPPAGLELLNIVPGWMREALNVTDAQRGIPVKRGQSGEAYKQLLQEAYATIDDMETADAETLGRLLYALLVDTIRHAPLGDLRRLIGHSTPDEHIRVLKRGDPADMLRSVEVHSTSLRPKTRGEIKENFVSLVEAQVLSPGDAIREMLLQGGINIDTPRRESYAKQAGEIDIILAGGTVEVSIADNHAYHMDAVKLVLDSPRSQDMPPEVFDALQNHWIAHAQAEMQIAVAAAGLNEQSPGPAAGSAPGAAVEQAAVPMQSVGTAGVGT